MDTNEADKVKIDFGANLRKILADQGLSQREAAAKLEIGPSHLSLMMNGKKDISITTLNKLCNELGVSPSDLVPYDGGKK